MTLQQLLDYINTNIKTNGVGAITGAKLNTILCELASYAGFDAVTVETLPAGSDATATVNGRTLNLGIPKGADGADGTDGQNAVNPFKGWFVDTETLNSAYPSPSVGDYAYVKGAGVSDPASIYECTTNGAWIDSGKTADTSNIQTFASGQEVNNVNIVNDTTMGGVDNVWSAEQGKLLYKKLYGFIDMSQESSEITLNNYEIGGVVAARSFQNSETEAWKKSGNVLCGYITHDVLSSLLDEGYKNLKVTMPTAYQGRITFVKKMPESTLETQTYQDLVDGGYLCDVHDSYEHVCLICTPNATTVFPIPEDAFAVFFQYRSNDDGSSASTTLRKPSSVIAAGVLENGDIQDLEQGIPDNSIGTSKLQDQAVTSKKLADDAISGNLLESVEIMESYNLVDYSKTTKNKMNTDGEPVPTASDVSLTDYILIPQNGLVADNPVGASNVGNPSWVTYDEDFNKVSIGYTNGKMFLPFDVSYKYARFVLSNTTTHRIVVEATSDYANIPNSLVGALQNNYFEKARFEYSRLNQRLNIDNCIPDVKPSMSLCGLPSTSVTEDTLEPDTPINISAFPRKLKNCFNYNFKAFFGQFDTGSYIRVGNGRNATNGRTIEVTPTKINFLRYVAGNTNSYVTEGSVSHGLAVSNFAMVNIFADYNNVKVILTTVGGTFEHVFSLTAGYETYVNYGMPYALSNVELSNVEFSAYSDRFSLPVWVVGASYTSITEKRWTYQLIKTFGFDGFLIAGNPGDGSSVAIQELERLLAFGTPRYLVWMIGINDTPFDYKTYAKRLEILCKRKGIELIYTRVPKRCNASNTVVTDDKAEINEYVVNSGHRYVSLYDAVINPSTGLWFDGMNDDGTHPTVKGAKAMAAQVILDFPEIVRRKQN